MSDPESGENDSGEFGDFGEYGDSGESGESNDSGDSCDLGASGESDDAVRMHREYHNGYPCAICFSKIWRILIIAIAPGEEIWRLY